MGLSCGVETKQKSKRPQYTTHDPRLPLLAPEVLWRVPAQAIPLGLLWYAPARGRNQVQWCGAVAGAKHCKISCRGEHPNQTLLMHCCVSDKSCEKHCKNLKHCSRYKVAFYVTVINRFA